MSRQHWLILPDAGQVPSGGHLYNLHLFTALQKVGIPAFWRQWQDLTESDWQQLLQQPDTCIWVDSLYLTELRAASWLSEPRTATLGLLVHHLESLHPPQGWEGQAYFEAEEQTCLQALDAFWCTSTFTEAYLQAKGLTQQQYVVVPPALPEVPRRVLPSSTPLSAILVANWVERKGVFPFLQALVAQLRESDHFQLWIAGSETLEPEYARQAQEWLANQASLAQRVRVLGAVPQEQLWLRYPQQHVLISAAQMETYGMAMQEGQAFGLPILALNGGYAYAHVQEGITGHLADTYEDLASTFLAWVRQPATLQPLLEAAAKSQPHYPSWEEAAKRFGGLVD